MAYLFNENDMQPAVGGILDGGTWDWLNKIGEAARTARGYIPDPFALVRPTDIASFLPGGGIAQAGTEDFPNMIRDIRAGDYWGAAKNGVFGTLNTVGDGMAVLGPLAMVGGVGIKGGVRAMKGTKAAGIADDVVDVGKKVGKVTADMVVPYLPHTINVKKTGEIVGAPKGVASLDQVESIITNYMRNMEQGAPQRDWYTTSGKSILSHAGDDHLRANKLAEAFSATSANTGVKANTGHAVKGHNQGTLGIEVRTGQFPTEMGNTIFDVYNNGGLTSGNKRTPFGENLAVGGGFRDVPNPRPVHDIWDMRAHGYGENYKGTASSEQHAFLDPLDAEIIRRANEQKLGGFDDWNPLRSQAAAWRGKQNEAAIAKGKAPMDGNYDFADALPDTYAQGSRETVPGKTANHGTGLLGAPYDVRQAYDDEIAKIIYDAQGRDRIAQNFGALSGSNFQGPGVFEGGINPGRQTQIPVGKDSTGIIPGDPVNWRDAQRTTESITRTTGKGETIAVPAMRDASGNLVRAPEGYMVDPASRTLMDAIEGTYGMATGQDATAWSKTFDAPLPVRNANVYNMPLDNALAERLMQIPGFDTNKVALVPEPNGFRLRNLNLAPDEFNALSARVADVAGKPAGKFMDGGYTPNDWSAPEGILGQQYLAKITQPAIPEARAALEQGFDANREIFAQIRDVDQRFFKDHGFEVNNVIQDLRSAIANNGIEGIRALAKKMGVGGAGLAVLISTARSTGLIGENDG